VAVTRGQHLIGKTLGSYVLEKLLGYGGTSAVFLAQQHEPERKVAVKVFLPRTGMSVRMQRDFYRRFLREAEAASKLSHAHILPIYAYGEQDGLPYIVMPYMPGGTLSAYLNKRGPLSLQEAQWYLDQIASALDYAHEQGCVHCDVKPANMLLDQDGHLMLSDFGIARLARTSIDPEQTEALHHKEILGTPEYISPEQALGHQVDGRSDIYSLGVTLFFMVAKRMPFRADSTIALALLHIHESPPSLALIRGDVSPKLDQVVQKALAKDPDERFQSAGEFSAAFANAIESDVQKGQKRREEDTLVLASNASQMVTPPPVAESVVRIKPAWTKKTPRKRLIAIGLACCVLLALFLSFNSLFWHAQPIHATSTALTPTASTRHVTSLSLLQDVENWPSSKTFFFDKLQQYHIVNTSSSEVALASYAGGQFQDFHLAVTMVEKTHADSGPDYYGVVFRTSPDQAHYYLFEFSPGEGGQYEFQRFDNGQWTLLYQGVMPAIVSNANSGKSNTLTITAHGNAFSFTINGSPVSTHSITDTSRSPLQGGGVGLYVENKGMEIIFSHLYIETVK
jgi:serine/threonine protein kinase